MRNVLLFFLVSFTYNAFSQRNTYRDDLRVLQRTLQETPSYKAQIKGRQAARYKKLYDSLSTLPGDTFSSLDYFTSLAQLFFPLRDNHLGFYEVFDYKIFSDTTTYKKFQRSLDTAAHPSVTLNLDSLKEVLATRTRQEVEGIYYYDSYYSFGLYKEQGNVYVGVILDTQLPAWKKGQIVAKLYAYAPNRFRAVYAHPATKKFHLYPNEKFGNESLLNSYFYASYTTNNYRKTRNAVDHTTLGKQAEPFELTWLRKDVQYLRLGNFSASPKMMEISDAFYESIKDSLVAKNLVVDLRDNTGGAGKVSRKFRKLLRHHAKRNAVHVLVNNGTISQGEIFLLQLRRAKNVHTYGQTTQGKIAYGSNYGKRVKLPGGTTEVYVTDMRDWFGRVKYESTGITPGVIFDNSADWLEQLLLVIGPRN